MGIRKDEAEKATEGVSVELGVTTGEGFFFGNWVKKRRGIITTSVIIKPKQTKDRILLSATGIGGGAAIIYIMKFYQEKIN